jgi:DnaJ family protein A protein 2/DnaJ-related protein SCJ1
MAVVHHGYTDPICLQVRKIEGEGMPVHNFPSQRGTLFVKYIVDLPRQLNEEQKREIGRLFQ